MTYKIGFIGGGHIARSLISGIVNSGAYTKRDICVYDKDIGKNDFFSKEGFHISESEVEVVTNSTFVFLTLRQPDLVAVLKKIAPTVTVGNVLISVAAGVSINFIKNLTRPECKVVRVMPNTPVEVGCGATALSYDMPVTYRELNAVRDIFETVGIVELISEDKMNEVISVSGSSPAYVYMLARGMIDGAKNQGIPEDVARRLVSQTILGAAKMIEQTETDISEMLNSVCSPNGTTIKAVEYLEKRGFEQAIADAMLTCTKRANLIEKELDGQ